MNTLRQYVILTLWKFRSVRWVKGAWIGVGMSSKALGLNQNAFMDRRLSRRSLSLLQEIHLSSRGSNYPGLPVSSKRQRRSTTAPEGQFQAPAELADGIRSRSRSRVLSQDIIERNPHVLRSSEIIHSGSWITRQQRPPSEGRCEVIHINQALCLLNRNKKLLTY